MASCFYYKKFLFVNVFFSNFTETSLGIYVGTMPSFRKIGELVSEINGNMIQRDIRFLYIGFILEAVVILIQNQH